MHQLVAQMDTLVGDVRPDIVITHSAQDLHWDHSLVNRATVSALRRWPCNVLAYLSSYEMNVQQRYVGQCFADITETIDKKVAGDLGAQVAAVEDGPRVDPRSGAGDGAAGRRRICRGLRSLAAALLMRKEPMSLQGMPEPATPARVRLRCRRCCVRCRRRLPTPVPTSKPRSRRRSRMRPRQWPPPGASFRRRFRRCRSASRRLGASGGRAAVGATTRRASSACSPARRCIGWPAPPRRRATGRRAWPATSSPRCA